MKNRYALVPFNELLTFVAVAGISGIIGNLSTDLVKGAISKIKIAISSTEGKKSDGKVKALIDDPEKMQQFMEYIDAYFNCFDELEPQVRQAIEEEIIVDRISPTMTERLLGHLSKEKIQQGMEISPFTDEEIFRMIIEARRDLKRRPKLNAALFEGFWEGVEPDREQGE